MVLPCIIYRFIINCFNKKIDKKEKINNLCKNKFANTIHIGFTCMGKLIYIKYSINYCI